MDLITMLRQAIESLGRGAGLVVNVGLLILFLLGASFSFDAATTRFDRAGGLPDLSIAHLVGLASSPDVLSRGVDYLLAWLFACVFVGMAWMSILGGRWLYHACLRVVVK